MNERGKNILLGVLIVGLVSMTVAYAALSQVLTINGSATIAKSSDSWNVHFEALGDGEGTPITTNAYATVENNASISLSDTIVTAPEVTLNAPGDSAVFKFKVVNDGTINAKLTGNTGVTYTVTYDEDETLTPAEKTAFENALSATLTYADGTALTTNTDTLNSQGEATLALTISLSNSLTKLPSETVTISDIQAVLTYSQN